MKLAWPSSIRHRLMAIILSTTISALVAGFAGMTWYDLTTFRREMVSQTLVAAQIVGSYTASELAFDDRPEARRTLAKLGSIPDLESAVVYDADQQPFAAFPTDQQPPETPPFWQAGHELKWKLLHVVQPIVYQDERFGTLYLRANTGRLRAKIARYLRAVVALTLGLIGLTVLVAAKLQGVISKPVLRLARAARSVSESGDYSSRVARAGSDEVGVLYDAWNEMLSQLERRQHEQTLAEAALRRSEARFRQIIELSDDAIYVVRPDDRFSYVNPKFEELLEISLAEATAPDFDNLSLVAPESRPMLQTLREARARGEETPSRYEFKCVARSGAIYEFEANTTEIEWDGRPARLGILRDISRRKEVERQLTHNAFFDPLTDLPNRALFADRLGRALERARRHRDYHFAILFLDLDRFKVVNDSLGHHRGDRLLVAVAERLKAAVRAEDTVARFGGDEFAVLVEDPDDIGEVTRVAERILSELARPFDLSGREVYTSASIGIALGDVATEELEDFLRDADTAMYRAKESGGNGFQVFDREMHARAVAILQLEGELRRAVERDELVLHFQPIVALADRRLAGFEALVRWQHPWRGLLEPADFLQLAEETGVILEIDRWVLEAACAQGSAWAERFGDALPESLSVNLSSRQLVDGTLIERVRAALAQTRFPTTSVRLELELTETGLMQHLEAVSESLATLRPLGVGISVDDFGTGYSSLSYLRRLPIDTLKIDRSFVRELATDDENVEIVRAIIGLAKNLGLRVVAEGVESREQFEVVRRLGCDFGQGYWFAAPMEAERAGGLIAGKGPELRGGSSP